MVVKADLLIRRVLPGEFVCMAALAVRAWRIAARDIELNAARQKALEAKFQRDLQGNADGVLVAEKAGAVAGWSARVPRTNYISDLWIDPLFHGQGIGGQLLGAVMAQILLDGFVEALIGTHADNLPAINLYIKAGFQIDWQGYEWSESFGRTVEKVSMRTEL